MDMIQITVKDGQTPTKEQAAEIKAAVNAPEHYTDDCPHSTPKALAEFAAKARILRMSAKQEKSMKAGHRTLASVAEGF